MLSQLFCFLRLGLLVVEKIHSFVFQYLFKNSLGAAFCLIDALLANLMKVFGIVAVFNFGQEDVDVLREGPPDLLLRFAHPFD